MEKFNPTNSEIKMSKSLPASCKELSECVSKPGVTIMEWNIAADTLLFSKNQNHGHQYLCTGISAYIDSSIGIHTDDIPAIHTLVKNIMQGWLYTTAEFRLFYEDSGYTWYRLHMITLRDAKGAVFEAVGQIINIHQEKRILSKLKSQAEIDALTGVFNREQTETLIKQYLIGMPDELCALFVIDTDNFKLVNDTKGHMLGDVVLTEMAAAMKRAVPEGNVIGRIGGDEFVIFIKGLESEDAVKHLAETLQKEFRELFRHEKMSLQITCSIGIALYPQDGTEYKELFKHADHALYQAKVLGKDRYHLFNTYDHSELLKSGRAALGTEIDSDSLQILEKNSFLTDIFKLLYQTDDTDLSINRILEIVGKRFDVSRAYVFENTEDGRFSSNTYEWCNTGILPEKEHLQNVDYNTLGNYESLYDENSIFYCRDVSKLKEEQVKLFQSQNIHSVLQCAFWKDKKFAGFIGFDECTGLRLWTQEEVDTLLLISQMMTTFIQRRRAMEWNVQMEEQLHTVLDSQDSCLYVIDQNTYEILYLGKETKNLNPGIQLGDYCYKALFRKSGPCEFCPLMNGGTSEADIPGSNVHIKSCASSMKWLGNDAYLLSYTMDTNTAGRKRLEGEEDLSAEKAIVDCIQWLSSTEYMTDAIDYVLGVINRYYKADRVYIIEMDDVKGVANNTYEVCADGIEPQIDVLQSIPFEEITFWVKQFQTKGYIKIDDIEQLGEDRRGEYEVLKPQGITSLMAIPFYLKGGMSGFLGMDNPRAHKKNFHYLRGLCYFLENEIAKNALKKKLEQMN